MDKATATFGCSCSAFGCVSALILIAVSVMRSTMGSYSGDVAKFEPFGQDTGLVRSLSDMLFSNVSWLSLAVVSPYYGPHSHQFT